VRDWATVCGGGTLGASPPSVLLLARRGGRRLPATRRRRRAPRRVRGDRPLMLPVHGLLTLRRGARPVLPACLAVLPHRASLPPFRWAWWRGGRRLSTGRPGGRLRAAPSGGEGAFTREECGCAMKHHIVICVLHRCADGHAAREEPACDRGGRVGPTLARGSSGL